MQNVLTDDSDIIESDDDTEYDAEGGDDEDLDSIEID
jgi:hypothetical protein